MLRTLARILPQSTPLRYSISNWKLPSSQLDPAGIMGFFQCKQDTYLTVSQKMSQIAPMSLYGGFDEWTRQLLMTLSTNFNCGLGTSIILVTLAIKTIFLYPSLRAQIQGIRQKQIQDIIKRYKEQMSIAQKTGNQSIMKQASYTYKLALKKKGINNMIPMLNMFQIPILITWFLSLRYMTNLPQIYPAMLNQGYLWFSDLSTYDPYFVLPVAAAITTSLSIALSPNFAKNNLSIAFLAPYVKYLKYLPFASLAFTGFFPASLNLYWLTLAGYQLMLTKLMYSKYVLRKFGASTRSDEVVIKKPNVIDRAIFVQENLTSQQKMNEAQQAQQAQQELQVQKKKQQSVAQNQTVKTPLPQQPVKTTPVINKADSPIKTVKVLKHKPLKNKKSMVEQQ